MDNKLTIRDVRTEDAERLVEIYAHYVQNTAVSFEYEVPTVEEFANRIQKISAKYPYVVCLDQDKVIGYAYAGRYSPREAYNWTVTTSIYIDKDHHRKGAGTLLYAALEEKLRERGIVNLLAGIAYVEEEDEETDPRQMTIDMTGTQEEQSDGGEEETPADEDAMGEQNE